MQSIEDWHRGYVGNRPSKTGVRVNRDKQQVEHILPRGWKAHWPVADLAAEAEREARVHRLGNLTLLTGSLNAAVSNAAWLGEKGKRAAINKHDVFLMNRALFERSEDGWNESLIDARTRELTSALLETWPVAEGHKGTVVDRSSRLSKATASYAHLIDAGLLAVGAVLVCTDPRWPDARCEVAAGGRVIFEGESYSSPAAAARKVRGGSGNAWYFWRVEGGESLNSLRDRLLNDAQSSGAGTRSDTP